MPNRTYSVTPEKRKKALKLITDTMKYLDPSGKNAKEWENKFKSMNDRELLKFIQDLSNPEANFYLETAPFDGSDPDLRSIEKALLLNGSQCEEYIYFRDRLNSNGEMTRSIDRVPVFTIHIRRLQQIATKKNNFTYGINKRNALINQVTGEDKVARNSDSESYALIIQGAENTLKELMGPRADGGRSKVSMYRQIAEHGFTRLDQLDNDNTQKSTLRLLDVYLMSAGLKSDLLGPGLILAQTLKDQ